MSLNNGTTFKDIFNTPVERAVFKRSQNIITDQELDLMELVVHFCICTFLSYGGIVTNMIVIAVFAKQGFKDSVSVSMTAIAFWDLVRCLAGAIHRLAWPISAFSLSLKFTWGVINMFLAYLHIFVGYVSSVLAAYVSLERCLSVTIPFKVKAIITPRLTFIVMVVLSVVVLGSFLIVYALWEVKFIFSTDFNATVAIFQYSEFYQRHGAMVVSYYNFISVMYPLLSFIVIIVSTIFIVFHLQRASEFRSKNTNVDTENQGMSSRDRQVVKMLVVVIVVFIVNLLPRVVVSLVRFFIPEFYIERKHYIFYLVVSMIIFIFDFVNASTNLFIFLSMSSKFRYTFKEMMKNCRRVPEKLKETKEQKRRITEENRSF